MPDKISKVLGIVSGLSIVWIGGMLLWRRARGTGTGCTTRTTIGIHIHTNPEIDHGHTHAHSHGGPTHSHLPEGDISIGSLIALGASGGLVPCPSALILLLSAISIGRIGLGLVLLVSFSLGLAIVLMATGMAVFLPRNFLPERQSSQNAILPLHAGFFRRGDTGHRSDDDQCIARLDHAHAFLRLIKA